MSRNLLKLHRSMQEINRPFTVIVEGNIGSGKTRFLNHFKNHDSVYICSEPVQKWQDCRGYNLLGLMYEDPYKWAFSFQSYVQLTMLQQHALPTDKSVKIMERSLFSARYCFVEKLVRDGILPAPSSSVIHEWFKWIVTNTKVKVDLIVYLRTSPEVVHKRVMERNRKEERAIPIEYLQSLHEIHEEWLNHKTLHSCPAPVLTLNADLDKAIIEEEYEKFKPSTLLQKIALHA